MKEWMEREREKKKKKIERDGNFSDHASFDCDERNIVIISCILFPGKRDRR